MQGQYALITPPSESKTKKAFPGTYIFRATYQDRGSATQASLSGDEAIALRPAFQQAEQADSLSKGIINYRPFDGDTVVLRDMKHNSFVVFKHVDLMGMMSVSVGLGLGDRRYPCSGGWLEIRQDGPKGALLGKAQIAGNKAGKMTFSEVELPLSAKTDGNFHDLYFVTKNENFPSQAVTDLDWIRFNLAQ